MDIFSTTCGFCRFVVDIDGWAFGAFLLLPFQVSILHFTTPAVSATNFLYNITAIPSGVYRYYREKRMAWPLVWIVVTGTLPGVFWGYYLRVRYMPDPKTFKCFVGCVLFYIGARLIYDTFLRSKSKSGEEKLLDEKFKKQVESLKESHQARTAAGLPADAVVKTISFSLAKTEYDFWGHRFVFRTPAVFVLALVVGVIGGAYGIGGGAIIAPFCVSVFRLPVYTVAGAALMGTFITSIAGLVFYSLIPTAGGMPTMPDWPLGILFGIGGGLGMYCGASLQKYIPQKIIKLILAVLMLFVAARYIGQYFY